MARTTTSARTTGAGAGAQGTLGGIRQGIGSKPGKRAMVVGDEAYLWVLVLLEVGLMGYCRARFSRYHGG